MSGLRDLLASERGVLCLLVIAVSLVLVVREKLTGTEWVALIQWIFTAYAAGKTYTGIIERKAGQSPPPT